VITVTRERHLEGVVAKRVGAPDQPGGRGTRGSSTSTVTAND
jgi:hypothetical protein